MLSTDAMPASNHIVREVGDLALAHLAAIRCGSEGVIAHRASRSVYLKWGDMLVCLGLNDLGAGAISLLFDSGTKRLPPQLFHGDHVIVTENTQNSVCLAIEDLTVTIRPLSVYSSKLGTLDELNNVEFLDQFIGSAKSLLETEASRSGCVFVGDSAGIDSSILEQCSSHPLSLTNAFQRRIQRAKLALHDYLVFRETKSLTDVALLLGSGFGLTPSGDDFLCGVFHVLTMQGHFFERACLWRVVEPHVAQSTNAVSACMLSNAAHGHADNSIKNALSIIRNLHYCSNGCSPSLELSESDSPSTSNLADVLNNIGSTSGWDWFSGLLFGLECSVAANKEAASRVQEQSLVYMR